MARYRTAFASLLALAMGSLLAPAAHAYEEQASLDVALGYALLLDSDVLPQQGASLEVGGAVGISDIALVRGALAYAPLFDGAHSSQAGRLRVEAIYLLDVLRLVPFLGLGANVLLADGGGSARVLPGGHVVFGLDYLVSRTWTLGLDIRQGLLLERGEGRSTTEGALRLSRMFELY